MSQDNVFLSSSSSSSMSATPQHSTVGPLRLSVCPSTGGSMEVNVPNNETVQGLKNIVSKKLKIPPTKINLLFKERTLETGSLLDHSIVNGSQITLLPNVESGIAYQRPEAGVMQALENLTDSQVSDFLSGRAPLLLAMRMGDHMMFVQLQLTTQCSSRSRGQHRAGLAPSLNPLATRNISHRFRNLACSTPPQKQMSEQPRNPMPVSSSPSEHAGSRSCSSCRPPISGAVINSMQSVGNGIYSGTFSGTLDPALQDKNGRPKRDVTTILHILNDLLGASPKLPPPSPPPVPTHSHPCHHFPHPARPATHRPQPSPIHVPATDSPAASRISGPPSPTAAGSTDQETMLLREKVRKLQFTMEQRRLRRKMRRESKAPYQWSATPLAPQSPPSSQHFCHATAPTERPENMETSSYRKPNMEQETVAV